MMEQAAAAMMLVCSGNPLPSAAVEAGAVGLIQIPVNSAMLEKLRGEPPVGRLTFIGEASPVREWIIGGATDATNGQTSLIRLTSSNDPLSPFAFRAGQATQQDGGLIAFEVTVEGKCDLRPASNQSEGVRQ